LSSNITGIGHKQSEKKRDDAVWAVDPIPKG